jgi:hypothetical protein
MIIAFFVVFMAITFSSFMFVKNSKTVRWLAGGVSFALLAVSVLALTLHFTVNWGMEEVTTSTSRPIYTAGDTSAPYGVLVTSEVGKGTGDYVLTYRNDKDSEKPETNFKPDTTDIAEAVKKSATYRLTSDTTAKVVTTTTRLEYSSGFARVLFGFGSDEGTLVKQRSVVYVPHTWKVLTAQQAKALM